MRIVICFPLEQRHIDQIQAAAPEAEIHVSDLERIVEDILDADIFCGHSRIHMLPWVEVVRRGRLKWIQSSAAGMDHCLTEPVIESDILVTSASGVLADQVAEQTLAFVLSLGRSLPTFYEAQRQRVFERRPTRDLKHATVGILGFGGNGRRLAEVFHTFKARIIATDVYPVAKPDYVAELWSPEMQDHVLAESDFVVLCLPLTPRTRGTIDRRALDLMKSNAFLINVGRGKLIVEDDLVAVLEFGKLAGVGLDVTPQEPLPPASRLWGAPRTIITPHVGGQCATRAQDITDFFCENLRRYREGRTLLNHITDKRLGFPIPAAVTLLAERK